MEVTGETNHVMNSEHSSDDLKLKINTTYNTVKKVNGDSSESLSPSKNGIDSSESKHKVHSKSKDHHKHSSSKENSSEKQKEHKKSKDHSSSSSSSKHHKSSKESSSSSKHHKSSSSSKEKEKPRDHSSGGHKSSSAHSNSSFGHKEHKSLKDKHKSHDSHESKHQNSVKTSDHSSSKHRSKEEKSSFQQKEKDKSKSSDSTKVKSESVSKDKDKSKSSEYAKVKTETIRIETEPLEYSQNSDVDAKKKVPEVKKEIYDSGDDDIPLAKRKIESKKEIKKEPKESEDEDDIPLAHRTIKSEEPVKVKKEIRSPPPKRKYAESDSDDEPLSKRISKVKKHKAKVKEEKKRKSILISEPPTKKKKDTRGNVTTVKSPKKEKNGKEEPQVWKWWEEEKKDEGVKWTTLEHKGPLFAPPYEPLPSNVKFYYDGKSMKLSQDSEEVAGFYARMIEHDYSTKEVFNNNFFKDWRKVMTSEERSTITSLKKCNFKSINEYYKQKSEENKNRTKEMKLAIKKKNEELVEEYGFCIIDGHKEKIGNFRIEPPGLFRGRGEHPKMGKLKRRVVPSDIIINCGKNSKIPEAPDRLKWKEVRHDNKVTWLVSWTENVQGQTKYVMLNPSSKLKGEKDWQKYETARKLKKYVNNIRNDYKTDLKSKEMKSRQRAVALYFIDKLALRAGNEKDDETADTVGCCSLRVEHITLHPEKGGKEYVVEFDFLGKDSIRYQNSVSVEKRVFKNLELFMENKQGADDLFDRLNTTILNKYLNDLMEGLTAKVFRTYNASKTLQEQLDELTKEEMTVPERILSYNRANRAVAILCNHQRAIPKTFDKQMENLQKKLDDKKAAIKAAKKEAKAAKSNQDKTLYEKKKKAVNRLEEQLVKLDVQATDKEENKQIALGTSKLNYLDPRISVAWCKKWEIPIEKVYNKTQRDKFRWAIEMAGPDFQF